MCVITISREFGSQGSIIANKAAQALGYRLADKDTVEAVLHDYGVTQLKDEYNSIPGFWDRFDTQKRDQRKNTLSVLNHALCALARHDNVVILGRGGFVILQGYRDVLNVRVQAPLRVRIARVQERLSLGEPGRAEEMVKANDRLQREFIKSVDGADWLEASAFDLVIDTSKFHPDLAVELIVAGARALPAGDVAEPSVADLQVDSILAEAAMDALNRVAAQTG